MSELIPISQIDKVDVVDSRIVSEELGVQHESLVRTIKTYQTTIEKEFGHLRFENGTVKNSVGAVNQTGFYFLTEDQAIFIGTLSRNSERAVRFKAKLVKSFQAAKKVILKLTEEQPSPVQQIEAHTKRPVQIENAKGANKQSFQVGGKELCIGWNRKVAFYFTQMTPKELKEWAKSKGFPSKVYNSGKEVVRHVRPEKAAGISVADFFHSMGEDDDTALKLGEMSVPLVKKLLQYSK